MSATASRAFVRLATKSSKLSNSVSHIRPNVSFSRPTQRFQQRRGFASGAEANSSGGKGGLYFGLAAAAAVSGAGGYYAYSTGNLDALIGKADEAKTKAASVFTQNHVPDFKDYQAVYNDISELLESNGEYDDGSYGPVIVRLAWHASGTYDALTKTGGSNGATMRFTPESDHGANAGLKTARDLLQPVQEKYPWISYGDLWTLAGVCAIQEMGGPTIPWRPGRQDRDVAACTPDGRLPDASKEQKHLRAIFGRMGFNDQEIVALSGAHALGRCHTDRSGYTGPWTFSPTMLTNSYYELLMQETWNWKKWNGPKQLEDKTTKSLMMLPTDMVLVKDKEFRKHVERYAKSQDEFFKDFSAVIVKLFELGVPFTKEERFEFKTAN